MTDKTTMSNFTLGRATWAICSGVSALACLVLCILWLTAGCTAKVTITEVVDAEPENAPVEAGLPDGWYMMTNLIGEWAWVRPDGVVAIFLRSSKDECILAAIRQYEHENKSAAESTWVVHEE